MHWLIDKVFPRLCVICGYREDHSGLCDLCRNNLPMNENYCCLCGQPIDAPAIPAVPCGACQSRPPAYDIARAPCRYEFPIDAALKKLKFNRRLAFAPPLAGLLVPFVESELSTCDVLVPVPLNRWRQARRGFNQADELCRTVAKQTGLPIFKGAQRRRMTASQSGLSATARVRNVRDAFTVRALPPYRHPLIVDDVVTTGATCDELAKALKSAGAKTVSVIAVARASGN